MTDIRALRTFMQAQAPMERVLQLSEFTGWMPFMRHYTFDFQHKLAGEVQHHAAAMLADDLLGNHVLILCLLRVAPTLVTAAAAQGSRSVVTSVVQQFNSPTDISMMLNQLWPDADIYWFETIKPARPVHYFWPPPAWAVNQVSNLHNNLVSAPDLLRHSAHAANSLSSTSTHREESARQSAFKSVPFSASATSSSCCQVSGMAYPLAFGMSCR